MSMTTLTFYCLKKVLSNFGAKIVADKTYEEINGLFLQKRKNFDPLAFYKFVKVSLAEI